MKVIEFFRRKEKNKEEPFDIIRYYKRRLKQVEDDYYNLYIKSERLKEENIKLKNMMNDKLIREIGEAKYYESN